MLPKQRFLAATFCLTAMSSIACLGQNPVKFSTVPSAAGPLSNHIYAVDVNNDGVADIIQDTQSSPIGYTVSIAKGGGAFYPPVTHPLPSSLVAPPPMAFADFNHDANVDMVVPLQNAQGNQLAVYLGNGNGTFQSPRIETIDLPSGYSFGYGLVAADFNHDGKIDLVAGEAGPNGIGAVALEGDGAGGFTYKGTIFSSSSASNAAIAQMVIGDFDSDNNADVALTTNEVCNSQTCNTVVHVLYGNGAFGFQETAPYSTTGLINIGSGDLNGDGRTDLFGSEEPYSGGNSQLVLLYGQSNRTFATYYFSAPYVFSLAMADFNGDNRMDLVGFNGTNLTFYLAGTGPGEFKAQSYTLNGPNNYVTYTNVVVGNFDGGKRPGAAVVQNNNYGGSAPGTISAAINQTSGWYGACPYPRTGQGISLCTPANNSSVSNPTAFNASANSFGMIRKFELWVDGNKISEQHHTWGNKAFFADGPSFPAGYHHATLNVTTVDNDSMQYYFTFKTN